MENFESDVAATDIDSETYRAIKHVTIYGGLQYLAWNDDTNNYVRDVKVD